MSSSIIIPSCYLAPICYYSLMMNCPEVHIEKWEYYIKQTYRNRCSIGTESGIMHLTVPVTKALPQTPVKDIRISDHGNWRHLHWHALMSAYSESPFFEYYADDIRPFFEKKWDFLYDFNQEACHTVCSLLDIHPNIQPTSEYIKKDDLPKDIFDFREAIDPKHPAVDADFVPRRYYQVFERKIGFQPNLSILDLLFNMGPEGIFYLR